MSRGCGTYVLRLGIPFSEAPKLCITQDRTEIKHIYILLVLPDLVHVPQYPRDTVVS